MYELIVRAEPFIISAKIYPHAIPIVDHGKYIKVRDFIAHLDDVTASLWYRQLVSELREAGVALHKWTHMRSEAAVIEFLEGYAAGLVRSLGSEGYRTDKGGDIGKALIDDTGRLQKAGSGDHRFFASQILGIDRFPLRIEGVHAEWAETVFGSKPTFDPDELAAGIREVELRHRSVGDRQAVCVDRPLASITPAERSEAKPE